VDLTTVEKRFRGCRNCGREIGSVGATAVRFFSHASEWRARNAPQLSIHAVSCVSWNVRALPTMLRQGLPAPAFRSGGHTDHVMRSSPDTPKVKGAMTRLAQILAVLQAAQGLRANRRPREHHLRSRATSGKRMVGRRAGEHFRELGQPVLANFQPHLVGSSMKVDRGLLESHRGWAPEITPQSRPLLVEKSVLANCLLKVRIVPSATMRQNRIPSHSIRAIASR